MKQVYDLQMKINFCKIHKDFFKNQVQRKPNNPISLFHLSNLFFMLDQCGDCKIETLVNSDKK